MVILLSWLECLRRSQWMRSQCGLSGYDLTWPPSCYEDSAVQWCSGCSSTSPMNDSHQPSSTRLSKNWRYRHCQYSKLIVGFIEREITFRLWPTHSSLEILLMFQIWHISIIFCPINDCSVATLGSYKCILIRFTVFPYRGLGDLAYLAVIFSFLVNI